MKGSGDIESDESTRLLGVDKGNSLVPEEYVGALQEEDNKFSKKEQVYINKIIFAKAVRRRVCNRKEKKVCCKDTQGSQEEATGFTWLTWKQPARRREGEITKEGQKEEENPGKGGRRRQIGKEEEGYWRKEGSNPRRRLQSHQ